jgi:hypothetical protein
MTAHPAPSANLFVVVHLLDPAQGYTLQTWRFEGQDLIAIGRGAENDIALADPHVSRAHAKLIHDGNCWTLISTGRHGTLVDDRVISETKLHHHTLFRLGAAGPTLRFDTTAPESLRSETMDNIDSGLFAMLEIDERRKQQEVDQITGNSLFQELQEQTRRIKGASTRETDTQ